MTPDVRQFLDAKVRALAARARRLARLDHGSVGIRREDVPYTPSLAHFAAANRRLAEIDGEVEQQLSALSRKLRDPRMVSDEVLSYAAAVERAVDRARRTFALFFEIFSQRGTTFAPALAACDAIASDCFWVVREAAPYLLPRPMLKPVTYLESSFSPATFRRGVQLRRLLGEQNPFPLVRIPFERVESPWGMGVVLHEIGHNLHADLGIWQETQRAVAHRVLGVSHDPWLTRIWSRWHKEIFADLIALLLGGPASARSMQDFLAYPSSRVLSFRALSAHPTPYLRAFILAEMLRRMGFAEAARATDAVWRRLYQPHLHRARVPRRLLVSASRIIPEVVDEVAFQPRRGLAQKSLVDVVPFGADDERDIRAGARAIGNGRVPRTLPPRFLVSASRYAFDHKLGEPQAIKRLVLDHLARLSARDVTSVGESRAARQAVA